MEKEDGARRGAFIGFQKRADGASERFSIRDEDLEYQDRVPPGIYSVGKVH
jgi:hypothetical protein